MVADDPEPPVRGPLLRARRRLRRHHHRPPPGAAPGTLVAAPEACPTRARVMAYSAGQFVERDLTDIEDLDRICADHEVVWIDVEGFADLDLVRAVAGRFEVHPLALADVIHVHQRPKVEVYEQHLFIVGRMPSVERAISSEQLSLILGQSFVLTFQERPGDCFEAVRARIRQPRARLRSEGADYLAYALLDAVIDSYFPVLEHYGEALEALEDEVLRAPDELQVGRIHDLKRELMEVRRTVWPLREVVATLMQERVPFIRLSTRPYLRDCSDHVFQLMDMLETDRELASALMDLHISRISMRMNEVMKVLTVIATIFIPLSFIASLYGMNFDTSSPWNMPELGWPFGYPMALLLMGSVALGLLAWFRKKGWLG